MHAAPSSPVSAPPSRSQPAVLGLIGNTPTIPLRFEPEGVTIHAKCEFLNPSGSVKDRFAAHVISAAEASGALHAESVILE